MARENEYTIGVEEEYQVIDPATRDLSPNGEAILERTRHSLGEERVVPEMRASQVEALTPICRTLSEVRSELVRLRRGVIEAAAQKGLVVAAASTHPFSHWQDQPITEEKRYQKILHRERCMTEEQVVFGFHVHVGLSDRETALRVMNRARLWLAPLLALSANSPFWLGEDTGYASYRTQLWGTLPTAGPPGHFRSLAEHDALVASLVATGGAMEANQVYWDKAERDEPYPTPRFEILRAAHWVASRHGLDAKLVDVETEKALPAREVIESLLSFARPALEEHKDWDEVSALAREALERGNGATR